MARKKKTSKIDFDPWLIVQYALMFAITVDEQLVRGASPQLADNINALRKSKDSFESALLNRYEEFERNAVITATEGLSKVYDRISKKGLDPQSAAEQIEAVLNPIYTFFGGELKAVSRTKLKELVFDKKRIRELQGASVASKYAIANYLGLKTGEGLTKAIKEKRITDLASSESFPLAKIGQVISPELKIQLTEIARYTWNF